MCALSTIQRLEKLLADTCPRDSNSSILPRQNGFYDHLFELVANLEDARSRDETRKYLESQVKGKYQRQQEVAEDDTPTPDNLFVSRHYVDRVFRNFRGYVGTVPNLSLRELGYFIIQYQERGNLTSLREVVCILEEQRDSYPSGAYPEINKYLSDLIEKINQAEKRESSDREKPKSTPVKKSVTKRISVGIVNDDESDDSDEYRDHEELDLSGIHEDEEDLLKSSNRDGRYAMTSRPFGRRLPSSQRKYPAYYDDKPKNKGSKDTSTTIALMDFLKGKSISSLNEDDLKTLKELGYEVVDGSLRQIPDLTGIDVSEFGEDPLWYALEHHADKDRESLMVEDRNFYLYLERTRQLSIFPPRKSNKSTKKEKLDYRIQVAAKWMREYYGLTTTQLEEEAFSFLLEVKKLGMDQWIDRRAEIAKRELDNT